MTVSRVIRRREACTPVYLLDVEVAHGARTRVRGALWDGVLNASPEDTTDGPSPVEALLAGVAGCFVRNLRWYADGSHVEFERIALRFAAERSDDPPAITAVRMEVELETAAPTGRVAGIVERTLRTGTITRTVARAVEFSIVVRVNGEPASVTLPDWEASVGPRTRAESRGQPSHAH
jgi:uncharacterized OsmC-like protein